MAHEAETSASGFDRFGNLAADLIYEWGKAKIANEVRPPAPAATPPPTRPGLSVYQPLAAQQAQGSDVAFMLGEIFSSPRTWIGLAAIGGLVFLLIKLRR